MLHTLPLLLQAVDQQGRQTLGDARKRGRECLTEGTIAFAQDFAELVLQSTEYIGLHDTKLHQLRTHSYCQNSLLRLAFDGNESSIWLLSSSADRSRVGSVGLVPKYKGGTDLADISFTS